MNNLYASLLRVSEYPRLKPIPSDYSIKHTHSTDEYSVETLAHAIVNLLAADTDKTFISQAACAKHVGDKRMNNLFNRISLVCNHGPLHIVTKQSMCMYTRFAAQDILRELVAEMNSYLSPVLDSDACVYPHRGDSEAFTEHENSTRDENSAQDELPWIRENDTAHSTKRRRWSIFSSCFSE
jgi:hypothetical protein